MKWFSQAGKNPSNLNNSRIFVIIDHEFSLIIFYTPYRKYEFSVYCPKTPKDDSNKDPDGKCSGSKDDISEFTNSRVFSRKIRKNTVGEEKKLKTHV